MSDTRWWPRTGQVPAASRAGQRWVAGHALVLTVIALLSWVGRGWGYLVLYLLILATFGVIAMVASAILSRRSGSAALAFLDRMLRSFVLAEITLASALVATLLVARSLSGPVGPFPGGPFEGVPSRSPLEGAVLESDVVQMQIPADRPYTINTHGFILDGCLHVGADFVFPFKRWVHTVEANDRVTVRLEEELFEVRAVRIRDPKESRKVLEQVSRIRGVDPEDWLTEVWFFRVGCAE